MVVLRWADDENTKFHSRLYTKSAQAGGQDHSKNPKSDQPLQDLKASHRGGGCCRFLKISQLRFGRFQDNTDPKLQHSEAPTYCEGREKRESF